MRLRLVVLCAASLAVSACGGTKLVRRPPPAPQPERPLAIAADASLAAELGFVIVRNGPGAWAKNGDWDEYLVRLRNVSASPVQIRSLRLTDYREEASEPLAARKPLVQASKQVARRYRDAGLTVQAGRGGAGLVAAGVGAGVVGYGAAVAATTSAALGAGGTAGGGAAAAAGGLFLAAPVLVGIGIARMVNNGKVDDRIHARASTLPKDLAPGEDLRLDVFFPTTPSPQRLTVVYTDAQGEHQLDIDTRHALQGLHLALPDAPAP